MLGVIDWQAVGGIGGLVLAFPATALALGQMRDRRRRKHIDNQLRTSNGKTIAQIIEEMASTQRHVLAVQKRHARKLGRLRETQLEMRRTQEEQSAEQLAIAKTLGRHLRNSDEARRRLGWSPESDEER